MTHGSLFSGIGGFDLAAEWAGFENLFHCEWNPFCRKVLKHHFPNSESYEDITKTDFKKWGGRIDVITGGFPCQPFSVAGSRKGAEDDRYLWPQMLRAVEEIRPTWIIGENVTGILTMVLPGEEVKMGSYADITGESYTEMEERQMYVVERICKDFECIGYSVQPIIIPACAVGAPHRRDRIWFVAHRADARIETQCPGANKILSPLLAIDTNVQRRNDRKYNRKERHISDNKERNPTKNKPGWSQRKCGISQIGSVTSDPDRSRWDKQYASEKSNKQTRQLSKRSNYIIPTWNEFPTQSPVCNRNDGVSFGLAGISFPKWKRESIKALGNAIVPQVAYEIFKSILQIENKI